MPLYRYYFFKIYILLWCCYELQVEAEAPSFLVPIASTAPRSVNENSPKDLSILTVEGQDGDGDTLTFSISTQSPMSPPFELDSATGLFKTPNGLDAETTRSFVFTFGVSDGTTTVDSVQFTVNINDLNDNTPQFVGAPYSASLLDSVGDGTSVVNVTATDADITPTTISYSIAGGNTGTTFAIDTGNGQITVASSGNLNGAATYTLTVQASDGAKAGNATVTVAVREDFCTPSPCQNSGTCTLSGDTYNCSCTGGFIGQNCTQVDYCYGDPCVNGNCINGNTNYTCNCTPGYIGTNCSIVDYCFGDPCVNGVCINGNTNYTCNCSGEYIGVNCSQVDFCATSPCQNGGSCTNGATTHTCTCASGYTGTNCTEIEDDQDCDCCICPWLIPVVLGVVILITVGIFLYCMDKNDKLDGIDKKVISRRNSKVVPEPAAGPQPSDRRASIGDPRPENGENILSNGDRNQVSKTVNLKESDNNYMYIKKQRKKMNKHINKIL